VFFKEFAPYFALELLNKFSVNTLNKKIIMDGFLQDLKICWTPKTLGAKIHVKNVKMIS
jgi:hypothetical protein